MRLGKWIFVFFAIAATLSFVSAKNFDDARFQIIELSLIITAFFFSMFERRSSFFTRAVINLFATLYAFVSWLPDRAMGFFFANEPNSFFWGILRLDFDLAHTFLYPLP